MSVVRAFHRTPPAPARVVMLYPGQGSQYPGMARELYAKNSVFREAFDRGATSCKLPLRRLIFDGDRSTLDRTDVTQPAMFVVEYALTEMLRADGVEPDVVLGHSIGEYAAACAAGILTVEEAGCLVATRGRLMRRYCKPGVLLAVAASEVDLRPHLHRHSGVEVALKNASDRLVVGGQHGAIDRFRAAMVDAKLPARVLPVSHSFHTYLMEPMLERFSVATASVRNREAKIAFISSVTGAEIKRLNADYWVEHVRRQVRLDEALNSLLAYAPETVIEVGPGSTLVALAKHELGSSAARRWLTLLRQGADDRISLMRALDELPSPPGGRQASRRNPTIVRREISHAG